MKSQLILAWSYDVKYSQYINQLQSSTDNAEALSLWLIYLHIPHYKRGIQKVCRLTQLNARYVHCILSLFNIVSCNQNTLSPAFLQSLDYVLEELSILRYQPAICHADIVFPLKIAHLHGGHLESHLIYRSLGIPKSTPQMASRSV